MKRIIIPFLCFFVLLAGNMATAQESPVKWTFKTVKINDSVAELQFHATIDNGWHFYSQTKDAKCIEIPATFTFTPDAKYKRIGKVQEPKAQEEYDDLFDCTSRFFTKAVTFRQRVQVLDDQPFTIKGKVEGQACIEGRCTPVEQKFSFELRDYHPAVATAAEVEEPVEDTATATITPAPEEPQTTTADPEKEESLLLYFLIAIGGGLAGLVMPCVFPMIPMTVSFFSKEGHKGKRDALLYGLFIVLIFLTIGLVLSAIFGADLGNIMSTHWIPNLLFAVIFLIFAFSLLGYFEITLPSSWVNGSAKRQRQGGIAGIFFMALTLVLVSFSCTLPIAGAVALNAAGGTFLKPIIGMLGFSLGIAVPFTIFALFPGLLKKLPKSGGWMNTLKVILAFVELAFALKFINVPDQTYHWGILDREVYLAFWIVIFSLLGLYLLGKIRFPLDDEYPVQKSWFRFTLAIFVFTFVVYMIPGMWGAPLKALSGYLPPKQTLDFDLNRIIEENSDKIIDYVDAKFANMAAAPQGEAQTVEAFDEEVKYADLFHLAHNLKGYFDYDQALRCAKAQGKPIFIDFTGHGCVNCREMEANVWSDPRVKEMLRNDFVICALYVDDKTSLPKEECYVSSYDGKEKKTIGRKWADFQISKFGTNAQPYYCLMDHNGNLLMKPRAYDLDKDAFVNFLKDGIQHFQEGTSYQHVLD